MDNQQGESRKTEDQDDGRETGQQPAPNEEDMRCVACGHPIEEDDIECPNCGISLVGG
jgi:rubrerythrin